MLDSACGRVSVAELEPIQRGTSPACQMSSAAVWPGRPRTARIESGFDALEHRRHNGGGERPGPQNLAHMLRVLHDLLLGLGQLLVECRHLSISLDQSPNAYLASELPKRKAANRNRAQAAQQAQVIISA